MFSIASREVFIFHLLTASGIGSVGSERTVMVCSLTSTSPGARSSFLTVPVTATADSSFRSFSGMMCTAPSSFTSVPSGVSSRVFTEMSSFFFTPVINSMSCSPLFLACPGLLFQIKKSRNSFLTTVPGRDILCSRGTTRIAFFSPIFRGKTPTHLYLTRITDLPT